MNARIVAAVAERDLTVARRSPGVMTPMIVVPLVFTILLPGIAWIVSGTDERSLPLGAIADLIPAGVAGRTSDVAVQAALVLVTYVFPTLLMVVPVMVVSVTTADSIAGERERGTLEGVLLAPISDRELLVGKILSAAVPALVIHLAVSVVYAVAINVVLAGVVDGLVLPAPAWLTIVLWAAPAFTAAMIGASVLVSARARSVQGASQVTGVAVMPLILMVVGQVGGVALLSGWIVIALGAALWLAAVGLVWFGAAQLSRHRLARDLR